MTRARRERRIALAVLLIAAASPLAAQDSKGGSSSQPEPSFFFGLRGNLVGSDGEPTNDMLGAGLTGRFRLNERWQLGIAVDHSPGFDVETPYAALGIQGAEVDGEVVDAEGTATSLAGWLERVYAREGRRLEWFWGAGAGVAQVDVDPITGPVVGGGTFDIEQEVGTELLAKLTGGFRVRMGERWRLEVAGRLDQHFTDWKLTDRVSGRTGEFDDYLVQGIHVGLQVGF
jgi:hypothetical protein